jgi:ribonuclease-3
VPPQSLPLTERQLETCQQRIGYRFGERSLLVEALTHASGADTRLVSNERLEFLGDAILGMVVCERLCELYPDLLEGELTRIKSVVVSRETCARISTDLGLDQFLVLGKGMTAQSKLPISVFSDVFEALVAAIYLDGGWHEVRDFIERHVFPYIAPTAAGNSDENYKSQLQHFAQREFGETPSYVLLEEEGPDHSKSFCVAARVAGQQYEPAWGQSKKQAEQGAAKNALGVLLRRSSSRVER